MFIKNSKSIIKYFVCAFGLLSGCTNIQPEANKGVECRLYKISDSFPYEMKDTLASDCNFRIISLEYFIINNTPEDYFIPFRCSTLYNNIDTAYQSAVIATIQKKAIDTWFSTDIRWNGILHPKDSIRANLKITEGRLIHANIKKDIDLRNLMGSLEVRYSKCIADTIYSTKPIPNLRFTINDTIAIHYRDTRVHVAADHFFVHQLDSISDSCTAQTTQQDINMMK